MASVVSVESYAAFLPWIPCGPGRMRALRDQLLARCPEKTRPKPLKNAFRQTVHWPLLVLHCCSTDCHYTSRRGFKPAHFGCFPTCSFLESERKPRLTITLDYFGTLRYTGVMRAVRNRSGLLGPGFVQTWPFFVGPASSRRTSRTACTLHTSHERAAIRPRIPPCFG